MFVFSTFPKRRLLHSKRNGPNEFWIWKVHEYVSFSLFSWRRTFFCFLYLFL